MYVALRFDFRNPDFAGTLAADRYQAALEMAEWADELGLGMITLSEHHSSPDGHLPSPLPMAATFAARTTKLKITIAALLAPFYDPVRLAEDLIVLDHLSRGRIDVVIGAGYVREEFELYGVDLDERASRVIEAVRTLKAAFTGEPFEYRGRTVQITPSPFSHGGPRILLGGTSEAAARRAARIADGFLPAVPQIWDSYRDELRRLGRHDPGPGSSIVGGKVRAMALATDPEEGWARMGPYFLHENNAYGSWPVRDHAEAPWRRVDSVEALRAAGTYRVLTPEQYLTTLKSARHRFVALHPLCGGMPIDLAWSSLRLFEHKVLPAFSAGWQH